MSRAVFLDRDGTLNEDVGYVRRPEQLHLLPGVPAALRRLQAVGFRLIVVTNQSGVARGLLTENDLERIHERLREELARHGVALDAIYYCPHHPDVGLPPYRARCSCRKPATGMIEQAVREFGVDVARSFVVGDQASDVLLGQRAGCRTVLLDARPERPHPLPENLRPDYRASHLPEAVEWILRGTKGENR